MFRCTVNVLLNTWKQDVKSDLTVSYSMKGQEGAVLPACAGFVLRRFTSFYYRAPSSAGRCDKRSERSSRVMISGTYLEVKEKQ